MRKQVISQFISAKSSGNKKIAAFYDHSPSRYSSNPFIIIPPSYGETKSDSIALSYFLVFNGFNVIRYDGTDHIGESDGEIFNFTLRNAEKDLCSVLDYTQKKFKVSEVGIIAKSLAARVALRVASYESRIKFLLCIGGIINIQSTLKNVYQEDLVDVVVKQKYRNWKFADILGFEVSRGFLDSAILYGYHTLEGAKEDFKKLSISFCYIYAERDAWVDIDEVKELLDSNKEIPLELILLPGGFHRISENPRVSLLAFQHAVTKCKRYFSNGQLTLKEVKVPFSGWIAIQNRKEKKRMKKYEISKTEEKMFWKKYLTKYTLIYKSPDFREYLDSLLQFIGNIKENQSILDVGCGPAHLGVWLLKCFERNSSFSFQYVGIDFVEEILKEAKDKSHEVRKYLLRERKDTNSEFFFLCADAEVKDGTKKIYLPFKDASFNIIFCSLFLSYIKNYKDTVNELCRILKPGGKIVISSLKPYNDLSQIYRNFLGSISYNVEDIIEARKLLSSAGKIIQKEKQQYYHFFSEEEFRELVRALNVKSFEVKRSFGNQANILIVKKK